MPALDCTTLDRVKATLAITDNVKDSFLTSVLKSVSAEFEAYLGRHVEAVARTERYASDFGTTSIWLRGWPVTTITEIKFAGALGDFATVEVLSGTNYSVNYRTGEVEFVTTRPSVGVDQIQVIYTGGMAVTTAGLIDEFPQIAYAADIQAAEEFRRAGNMALAQEGGRGGGRQWHNQHGLLDRVRELLDPHRSLGAGGW